MNDEHLSPAREDVPAAGASDAACCSAEQQEGCCSPADKAACCGVRETAHGGCGCG